MKVSCRTNLDLKHCHRVPNSWPDFGNNVPRVGEYVTNNVANNGCELQLKVVSVNYRQNCFGQTEAIVELHLPSWYKNILEFQNWYSQAFNYNF